MDIADWRALRAEDEKALYVYPETVMRHLEKRLIARWKAACESKVGKMPWASRVVRRAP